MGCPTGLVARISRGIPWYREPAERKENHRLSLSLSPCASQYDLATAALGDDSDRFGICAATSMGSSPLLFLNFRALVHPFQCLRLRVSIRIQSQRLAHE